MSEAPLPPNTLRNADGTSYRALVDDNAPSFPKRFVMTVKDEGKDRTLEGVIFSDETIVVHGAFFHACLFTEAELKQKFPDAWIQRLD